MGQSSKNNTMPPDNTHNTSEATETRDNKTGPDKSQSIPAIITNQKESRQGTRGDAVAMFQSLAPGTYWRAKRKSKEREIEKGTVLLIKEIKYIDDISHTVVLHGHPLDQNRHGNLSYDILVKEFLHLFEFEPDGKSIREREMATLQKSVEKLQVELLDLQRNPARLIEAVTAHPPANNKTPKHDQEQECPATFDPSAGLPSTALEAASITDIVGNAGHDLASTLDILKKQTQNKAILAEAQANQISEKVKELSITIEKMAPFYEEQAVAILAACSGTLETARSIMKGLQTLDLYLGRKVDVATIKQGEPANPMEPLTLFQRKLYMDEETLINVAEGGADFKDFTSFTEDLAKSGDLLNRILPVKRGIVMMAYRRNDKTYSEDPIVNNIMNTHNRTAFLIIRNGENIFCVHADIDLKDSTRLFPTKDEMSQPFRGIDGSQIPLNDIRYADSRKAHDDLAYHYKRLLVLICGLQDRLQLFGQFDSNPTTPNLNFLDKKMQQRVFRFVYDDERNLIGEGRPPFKEWMAAQNRLLRSGSRVACLWDTVMTPQTAPFAVRSSTGYHNCWIYNPVNEFDIAIAYKDGEKIKVDARVKHSWRERQLNATVTLATHNHINPDAGYLVMDAVKSKDLDYYINNRMERQNYIDYIRMFVAARKLLEAEQPDERSMAEAIKKALLEGHIAKATPETQRLIGEAIRSWRASHRGKPIPPVAKKISFTQVLHELLDQMYVLVGAGPDRAEFIKDLMAQESRQPLRLVLTGKTRLHLYATPTKEELAQIDAIFKPVWVQCITLEAKKTKFSATQRKWCTLPDFEAQETTLHEWKEAKHWAGLQAPTGLTFGDATRIERLINHNIDNLNAAIMKIDDDAFQSMFPAFKEKTRAMSKKHVNHPHTLVPIALTGPSSNAQKERTRKSPFEDDQEYSQRMQLLKEQMRREKQQAYVICAVFRQPELIFNTCSSPAQEQKVKEFISGIYRNPSYGLSMLKKTPAKGFAGLVAYKPGHIRQSMVFAEKYGTTSGKNLKELKENLSRYKDHHISYFPNAEKIQKQLANLQKKTKEADED